MYIPEWRNIRETVEGTAMTRWRENDLYKSRSPHACESDAVVRISWKESLRKIFYENVTRVLHKFTSQRSWVKAEKEKKSQKWFSGQRELSCKVGWQQRWKFVQRTSPSLWRFPRSVKCAREAHWGLNRRTRRYWPIWLVARNHNPTTHRPRWPTGSYQKRANSRCTGFPRGSHATLEWGVAWPWFSLSSDKEMLSHDEAILIYLFCLFRWEIVSHCAI